MLRIEGNRSGRWIARFAVAAAMALCVANPASARRQGVTTWTVQGPQGGPFTPTSGSVKITNNYNTKLRWWATGDTSWVSVQNTGIVLPGQSKTVNLTLIETTAAQKSKGTYKAQIAFRDPSTGAFSGVADLLLVVGDPPTGSGQLTVTPPDGLSSSGNQGGTFGPLSKSYTLQNTGSAAVDWRVSFDDSWVSSPNATVGQLQPGASTTFDVQLDGSQLSGLAVGQYGSHVHFWDAGTNLEVATRDVNVDVKTGSSGGAGWTQFNPSPDTRMVYVSSSQGNDANNGLSEASPKKSISAGVALLRNNYPDWLLLKKGDTWVNEGFGYWTKSGRSAQEKMLINSYGSGNRPRLRTANMVPFDHYATTAHIAIADLDLECTVSQPSNANIGMVIRGTSSDVLIEGCRIDHYQSNIIMECGGPVTVRRCVITRAYVDGLYANYVKGLVLEENVFYANSMENTPQVVNRHHTYIDNEGEGSGVVFEGNLLADAWSNGIQVRPGGIVRNNVVARCGIAVTVGDIDAGPVNYVVENNTVLDGLHSGILDGPWGMVLQGMATAKVSGNIVANNLQNGGRAVRVDKPGALPLGNLEFSGNVIYNWRSYKSPAGWGEGALRFGMTVDKMQSLKIFGNDLYCGLDNEQVIDIPDTGLEQVIQSGNNRFYSAEQPTSSGDTWAKLGGADKSISYYKSLVGDQTSTTPGSIFGYNSPDGASIPAYSASIGGPATHELFMAQAILQCRDNWRPEYTGEAINSWVRAKFNK